MTYPKLLMVGGAFVVVLAVALIVAYPWSEGTSAGSVLQGDVDCDQEIDEMDALGTLQRAADIEPFATCVNVAGDVDCNHIVDADDTVAILEHTLDPQAQAARGEGGCTPIGESLGSATPLPTGTTPIGTIGPTPTDEVTPTPIVTPPPTNVGPQPDTYRATEFLTANYLGDAAEPNIELALMPGEANVGFVVRQDGYIYRVALDQSSSVSLWGDLSDVIEYDFGEQGLLSVQFSPDFESDGRVYVYYSTNDPDETRLARLDATVNDLDENSLEVVLHVEDFAGNHNGGHIAFDNAGLLYLSTGDGGGGGDPEETGQDINRLLGKVLRLDVSGETGYAIPPSNPFVAQDGRDEIFAYGFRNPFRMTIDPVTNEVWLGDVGQGSWEEVDHVVNGGNYGWDCREGNAIYNDDDFPGSGNPPCDDTYLPPRAAYDHGDDNQAITGGVIYRGDNMPELYGWYVYADFYSGNVWAVDTEGGEPVHLMDAPFSTSSFTLAPDGEVWFVSYSDGVYQLTR